MKQFIFLSFTTIIVTTAIAQTAATDSLHASGKITVIKDPRLDVLAEKEALFNEELATSARSGKGYRLIVLSTNDRSNAMKVRAQLLQHYPGQKVYMTFQPPYIKLKFGDFLTKDEADDFRKELLKTKLITNNIYLVPDTIEIQPDKNKEPEK